MYIFYCIILHRRNQHTLNDARTIIKLNKTTKSVLYCMIASSVIYTTFRLLKMSNQFYYLRYKHGRQPNVLLEIYF